MISSTQIASLAGNTMVGKDGSKIGKIVDVYESTEGADGTFVTVSTGLFGGSASFVPLAQASLQGNDVVVPYDKELVKHAPRVEADQELTSEEEDRLYRHYNLTGTAPAPMAAAPPVDTTRTAPPVDTTRTAPTAPVAQDTDGVLTRSEERLNVGVERVETGRVRLRKRIVSETVSTTVPVSHTEARVVREPITGADAVSGGLSIGEQEVSVPLIAETPVVSKETVAVEKIRLDTQTVTENVAVSEQVRKEQIEVDQDGPGTVGR